MGLTQITGNGLSENINIDSNTLKVDGSNNRVGIGTGSPTSKLTVAETGYSAVEIRSNRTSAADNIGAIHFRTVSTDVAYIQSLVDGTLKFRNTSALTERMRIDSSGRVAIGHQSPSDPLHVKGASGIQFSVDTPSGGQYTQMSFRNNGTQKAAIWWNNTASSLVNYVPSGAFAWNIGSEKMRIDSSGNVGIGTTSPISFGPTLQVAGTDPALLLQDTATAVDYFGTNITSGLVTNWYDDAAAWAIGTASGISGTGYTERMRIDSLGNVGIGNSNPVNSSGYNTLTLGNGTSTGGQLLLENSAGNNFFIWHDSNGANIYNQSATSQIFYTNSLERMRLDSSGRLLIGTSSDLSGGDADAKLQVNGDAGAQILLSRQDFGALTGGTLIGEVVFRSQASGVKETSALIKCEADGTQGSGDKPGRLMFLTTKDGASSPTERMRINSAGRLSGQAIDQLRVESILYARLIAHGGCASNGPSGTFMDFDSSEASFITVSRTTSTATSGYSFIGDGNGQAWCLFVGCGDNPVFVLSNKDQDANTYRSWVLVDNNFAASLGGAPLNATRTSLP